MAIKRYELSEAQWLTIASLLPGKIGDPGRSGSGNRMFINGCLWVLRSGAHWRDLPERYGKWKSVLNASAAGAMQASGSGCPRR